MIGGGQIKSIRIIDGGEHYSKVPRVYIRGLGKGARAAAVIEKGKVVSISILHGGEGYNSTPTIIIEKPKS